jgi:hypothetical protein
MVRTRQPVLCIGGDSRELYFATDDDFGETDDLPITPDDGPIILKLEVELDALVRIVVTRTLVWETDPVSRSPRLADELTVYSTRESFASSSRLPRLRSRQFSLGLDNIWSTEIASLPGSGNCYC